MEQRITPLRFLSACSSSVLRAFPKMPLDPLTCVSLKYPAPVCDDCCRVMVSVAMIFNPSSPNAVTVTYYRCEQCGHTLGAPRRRKRNCNHFTQFVGLPPTGA